MVPSERLLKFTIQAPISVEAFWELRCEMSEKLREKIASADAGAVGRGETSISRRSSSVLHRERNEFPGTGSNGQRSEEPSGIIEPRATALEAYLRYGS